MRRIVILLSVIAAMGAVTSRLAAQEPPRLERCSGPSEPIGELAGSGTVSFRILRNGHVDSATITVVRAEGISPAGVLSLCIILLYTPL